MGCVGVERIHIPQERVKCLNPVKIFGLETLIPCRQRGLAQFGSHDWQPEDIQYWSTLGPSHLSSLLGLGMILFTGVHRSTHLVLINHTKGHPWPTTEAPPPIPNFQLWDQYWWKIKAQVVDHQLRSKNDQRDGLSLWCSNSTITLIRTLMVSHSSENLGLRPSGWSWMVKRPCNILFYFCWDFNQLAHIHCVSLLQNWSQTKLSWHIWV